MKDFIKITTKGRVRYIRKSAIIAVSEGPDEAHILSAKREKTVIPENCSILTLKDYDESILADQNADYILSSLADNHPE